VARGSDNLPLISHSPGVGSRKIPLVSRGPKRRTGHRLRARRKGGTYREPSLSEPPPMIDPR
jgi:hypothetical protein